MGLDKLIQSIAIIASLAVASGHLPQALETIRQAQIQLIQESQASKWGQALFLPTEKSPHSRDTEPNRKCTYP